jgi:molybdopterin converting factor small subunit
LKIEIIAFGIARDIVGQRQTSLDIDLPTSARNLKDVLVKKYPSFLEVSAFSIAIGDDYAQDEDMISEKDVITIIPPVSGG